MEVRSPDGADALAQASLERAGLPDWPGRRGCVCCTPRDRQERDSAPAENLLVSCSRCRSRQGLSTLVLMDEVLMCARDKVGQDPALARIACWTSSST